MTHSKNEQDLLVGHRQTHTIVKLYITFITFILLFFLMIINMLL